MEFGEKLRYVLKNKYSSISESAEKLDVNYTQLSHYLNGRRDVSFEFLLKVIKEIPETDLNWLLRSDVQIDALNESGTVYKKPQNSTEIITAIEALLVDLKTQLPQK